MYKFLNNFIVFVGLFGILLLIFFLVFLLIFLFIMFIVGIRYLCLLYVFLKVCILCKFILIFLVNKWGNDDIDVLFVDVNFWFNIVMLLFVWLFFRNLFKSSVKYLLFFCRMIFVNLKILKSFCYRFVVKGL